MIFSLKKYFSLSLIPLFLLLTVSFSSCDPHRSGSVIKGPSAKHKYHIRPASGKRPRKNKY